MSYFQVKCPDVSMQEKRERNFAKMKKFYKYQKSFKSNAVPEL